MQESIEPFIHRKIVVLNEDDSVESASRAMCHQDIGCVVIAGDDGEIAGILTDRDLACFVVAEGLSADTRLYQIMTRKPVVMDERATLRDAVQLMKEYGIRRVPVVSEINGIEKCIGLVTFDDLIALRAIDARTASEIVRAQIRFREKPVPNRASSIARLEQTYHEFIKKMGEELDLKEKATEEFLRFVLGSLVRRMQVKSAAHFLAQLPLRLQQELSPFMVGPDRSITASYLTEGIIQRFSRKDYEAVAMLRTFWAALSRHLSGSAAARALGQFPRPLQQLLINHQAEGLMPPLS